MSKSPLIGLPKTASSVLVACLALVILVSGTACVEVQEAATKLKDKAEAVATSEVAEAVEAIAKGEASSAGESIKVGDSFPALNLKDQNGKAFDLKNTLKGGAVALVIFRSADW